MVLKVYLGSKDIGSGFRQFGGVALRVFWRRLGLTSRMSRISMAVKGGYPEETYIRLGHGIWCWGIGFGG